MKAFQPLATRPVAFWIICAGIIGAGILSLMNLPTKLYPNTSKTSISVDIPHSTMGAEDFAREYSRHLNGALGGLDGLDTYEIEYMPGETDIRLEFEWGVDGTTARTDVENAMASIERLLPEEAQDYSVRYWAGRTAGFYAVAVYSETLDDGAIYEAVEPLVAPRLTRIRNTDIARVNQVSEWSVTIELRPERLLANGLRADEVFQIVRNTFSDKSLGSIQSGRNPETVRIALTGGDPHRLGDLTVRRTDTDPVRLRDVAEVLVRKDLPQRIYTINGKRAVVIFAMPSEDGNIRELSAAIEEILADVKPQLPESIRFRTIVNPDEYISRAIQNVIQAGIAGALLAVIVCLIFLGSIRTSLQIAFSMPVSLFLSFTLMKVFGVSINLISLGGLTLSVGMIVDASIVVLENIHRVKSTTQGPLLNVITQALGEVYLPVIASVLTSVVVFVPIILTTDLTSAVLGDLALCVIFVLFSSLIVALVLVPALSFLIEPAVPRPEATHLGIRFLAAARQLYLHNVTWILKTRTRAALVILTFALALAAAIVFQLPHIEREILAKPDSARVSLRMTNRNITRTEDLLKAVEPIEANLIQLFGDRLENLFGRVSGTNTMNYTLTLTSASLRDDAINTLQDTYPSDDTWRYLVRAWDPADIPLPRTDDLKVRFIDSPGTEPITSRMDAAVSRLREAGIYKSVEPSPDTAPLVSHLLTPRPEALGFLPTDALEQFAQTARLLTGELRVGQTEIEGNTVDIKVRLQGSPIHSIRSLTRHFTSTPAGPAPLGHFFTENQSTAAAELIEIDGEDAHYIYGDLGLGKTDSDRTAAQKLALQALEDALGSPSNGGYEVMDGRAEISSAQKSLLGALALSVLLILFVLAVQFNSLTKPLVITLAIPLGFTGVIFFLHVCQSTLSLNSLLGTILLSGLTVNNSILLIDVYSEARRTGHGLLNAILQACAQRFRPILMTTFTTILGMLPIALALGEGANVIQPLGIAVSGGLLVSTLSTLVVIPAFLRLAGRSTDDPHPTHSAGAKVNKSILLVLLALSLQVMTPSSQGLAQPHPPERLQSSANETTSNRRQEPGSILVQTLARQQRLQAERNAIRNVDRRRQEAAASQLGRKRLTLNNQTSSQWPSGPDPYGWDESGLRNSTNLFFTWNLYDGGVGQVALSQSALPTALAVNAWHSLLNREASEAARLALRIKQLERENRLLEATIETRSQWLKTVRSQIRQGRRPSQDEVEFEIQKMQVERRKAENQAAYTAAQRELQALGITSEADSLVELLGERAAIGRNASCSPIERDAQHPALINDTESMRLRIEEKRLQLELAELDATAGSRPVVDLGLRTGVSIDAQGNAGPEATATLDFRWLLADSGGPSKEAEVIHEEIRLNGIRQRNRLEALELDMLRACQAVYRAQTSTRAAQELSRADRRLIDLLQRKRDLGAISDFEWISRQLTSYQSQEREVLAQSDLEIALLEVWLIADLPPIVALARSEDP
jgi:HAE1 family hydrophobic/amphiphilic exporter-1